MKLFYLIQIILLIAVLFSCKSPATLNKDEYLKWYQENKDSFIFTKDIDVVHYSLEIIPESVFLAKRLEKEQNQQSRIVDNKALQYIFKISNVKGNSILYYGIRQQQDYFNRVNYYSFGAENDFLLFNKSDTSYCNGVHFERTYELTPYITLDLNFSDMDLYSNKNDLTFEYNDQVFNNGKIRFVIPYKTINSIPKLKL